MFVTQLFTELTDLRSPAGKPASTDSGTEGSPSRGAAGRARTYADPVTRRPPAAALLAARGEGRTYPDEPVVSDRDGEAHEDAARIDGPEVDAASFA